MTPSSLLRSEFAFAFMLLSIGVFASPARAADALPAATAAAAADKETVDLVKYFLTVDLADANPKLIGAFLAVNTGTLPAKMREAAAAKQVQITALLRVHDVKKKGIFVQPTENCSEKDFIKPMNMMRFFSQGYELVNEDELKYVMDKTKCTEIDLGCRFSMLIFFEKKKDRVVKFVSGDPIMAIVAESHGGGSTKFFGLGFTCMH
ncbi:MAG: hypothetical protein ACHQ2Z_08625 [Elusimicrobiota bacterium]